MERGVQFHIAGYQQLWLELLLSNWLLHRRASVRVVWTHFIVLRHTVDLCSGGDVNRPSLLCHSGGASKA